MDPRKKKWRKGEKKSYSKKNLNVSLHRTKNPDKPHLGVRRVFLHLMRKRLRSGIWEEQVGGAGSEVLFSWQS